LLPATTSVVDVERIRGPEALGQAQLVRVASGTCDDHLLGAFLAGRHRAAQAALARAEDEHAIPRAHSAAALALAIFHECHKRQPHLVKGS
jgi:hypothetical protein